MQFSDIAVVGLAVMGENLALNLESRGYKVSVYNRPHPDRESVVDRFLNNRGKDKNFAGTHTVEQLTESLRLPRKIILMVKAGEPVDELIEQLSPWLSPGDVLIDGGNSNFTDTIRRTHYLKEKGIFFMGVGISGGEEGALRGPSIMPGGDHAGWSLVKDILQNIAAKFDDGTPCCDLVGDDGAGHFVKMVHNGIEYADLQSIAETYSILRHIYKGDNDKIADVFADWNRGELNSYLIEITAEILKIKDEDGSYMVDNILDVAGQKGTGKWSVLNAIDLDEPLMSVAQSVFARFISARLDERKKNAQHYPPTESLNDGDIISVEEMEKAYYAAKLINYAQNFSFMHVASEFYKWKLDYSMIAGLWRKGCIIRSLFLTQIMRAYNEDAKLENLLFDKFFMNKINQNISALRKVVIYGVKNEIALPVYTAALSYFDAMKTEESTANLIQAQRDYFGAHTYERKDKPRGEFFHTNWTGHGGKTVSGTYNV